MLSTSPGPEPGWRHLDWREPVGSGRIEPPPGIAQESLMLSLLSCLSLLLFTVVVSQPLFYWMALGRATRGLSCGAYVELRQQINAAIVKRLIGSYVVTLIALLALAGTAWAGGRLSIVGGAIGAAFALIVDLALAAKLNIPINKRMDGWQLDAVPSDWESQRNAWDAALGVRRVVLLMGFVGLVVALF